MPLYGPGQDPQIKWTAAVAVLMFGIAITFAVALSWAGEPLDNVIGMTAIFAVVGFILAAWAWIAGRSRARAKRLLADGIPGTASILGYAQTGRYLNKQPYVLMDLEVETGIHGKFTTRKGEYVPLSLLSVLTSGIPLQVRVDRQDRSKLAIDWQQPARARHA